VKGFFLVANRKDDYNRKVRDILGGFSDPQLALLASKQFTMFYTDKVKFSGFELMPFNFEQQNGTMYSVCIRPHSKEDFVSIYTYPMDNITASRYTGRTVSPIEYVTFAKDQWQATAIAMELWKQKMEEREKNNDQED
jgi:hypothetical protein